MRWSSTTANWTHELAGGGGEHTFVCISETEAVLDDLSCPWSIQNTSLVLNAHCGMPPIDGLACRLHRTILPPALSLRKPPKKKKISSVLASRTDTTRPASGTGQAIRSAVGCTVAVAKLTAVASTAQNRIRAGRAETAGNSVAAGGSATVAGDGGRVAEGEPPVVAVAADNGSAPDGASLAGGDGGGDVGGGSLPANGVRNGPKAERGGQGPGKSSPSELPAAGAQPPPESSRSQQIVAVDSTEGQRIAGAAGVPPRANGERASPPGVRVGVGGGVGGDISFDDGDEEEDWSWLVPEAGPPRAVWQGHRGPVAKIGSCSQPPCFFTLGEVRVAIPLTFSSTSFAPRCSGTFVLIGGM